MSQKGRKRKLGADEKTSAPPAAPPQYTHWLIKSEPETRIEKGVDMKFSFEDLLEEKDSTACWDGVRNYGARNFMRQMKVCCKPCYLFICLYRVGNENSDWENR